MQWHADEDDDWASVPIVHVLCTVDSTRNFNGDWTCCQQSSHQHRVRKGSYENTIRVVDEYAAAPHEGIAACSSILRLLVPAVLVHSPPSLVPLIHRVMGQ